MKKSVLFFSVLLLTLTLASCRRGGENTQPEATVSGAAQSGGAGTAQSNAPTATQPITFAQVNQQGNSGGNLAAGGLFAEQDGWLFYISAGQIERMRTDATEPDHRRPVNLDRDFTPPITDNWLNVSGDWAYFRSGAGFTRARIDGWGVRGGDNVQVLAEYTNRQGWAGATIIGDRIYFVDIGNGGRAYRMRHDGTERERLNDMQMPSSSVFDAEWIYTYSAGNLRRISHDGSVNEQLTRGFGTEIFIDDGWIYTRNALRRIRTDGSDEQQFGEGNVTGVNVSGDFAFFSNTGDGGSLYRIRTDGTDMQKLNDVRSESIHIAGGWVYYTTGHTNWQRIRTDGTDRQSFPFLAPLE